MAALKSILSWKLPFGGGSAGDSTRAPMDRLFTKTSAQADGDGCLHDCESCSVRYPRGFKIEEDDALYGGVNGWSTHLIVGTGKTDWVRDVTDEKGSVMEAVGKAKAPTNGKLMLSASNMPTPHDTSDYSEPTIALLLPAFTLIHNLQPPSVPTLIADIINQAPTNDSPLRPFSLSADAIASSSSSSGGDGESGGRLTTSPCPHSAVILMCSHRTRDARCGQSAPLLRKELERHLRPLGLYRDLHDQRPGGVGIYFINHVGGHKYSANMMIYRRPNAFGQDEEGDTAEDAAKEDEDGENAAAGEEQDEGSGDVGAAQCFWLARVRPEDCENLVKYTVLKGKVVKPESQLRGGFNRSRGLISW